MSFISYMWRCGKKRQFVIKYPELFLDIDGFSWS